MIHRQSLDCQLWGGEGVHPAAIGCVHDGRPQCEHKFHVVNAERTQIYDFETFEEADKKFTELTGETSFTDSLIKQV